MATQAKRIREMVARAKKKPDNIEFGIFGAWRFGLSFNSIANAWQLSAQLTTCGSTTADWELFGYILAEFALASGLPSEERPTLLTPLETTPPDAVHHIFWRV